MAAVIGIRREDKNEWERRVPLVPADLADLSARCGLRFLVQSSPIRVFSDADYGRAGIEVVEEIDSADLILAVKEIPADLLRPGKTYVFFSHVIKGQPQNMPMLARLLELGCSLVDYEKILDERKRRLIFFGIHAGYAGMIETLWSLGRRLASRGLDTPLAAVRHAYEYEGLEAAKTQLREIAVRIARGELGDALRPLVFGIAGYGNVSRGCREILDCLGAAEVEVARLAEMARRAPEASRRPLEVVFKESDMVQPRAPGAVFELQEYYDHPERYRGCFERHLPHLDVLLNTVYWDERYPRLVTRQWARRNWADGRRARLEVIGDISCDIEGSVELTLRTARPDSPCYTYDAEADDVRTGCDGPGPVVMAVDNLPCELPREASEDFSRVLKGLVPPLAAADWRAELGRLELPAELKRAVIVHKGKLTPDYEYLKDHLEV